MLHLIKRSLLLLSGSKSCRKQRRLRGALSYGDDVERPTGSFQSLGKRNLREQVLAAVNKKAGLVPCFSRCRWEVKSVQTFKDKPMAEKQACTPQSVVSREELRMRPCKSDQSQ